MAMSNYLATLEMAFSESINTQKNNMLQIMSKDHRGEKPGHDTR